MLDKNIQKALAGLYGLQGHSGLVDAAELSFGPWRGCNALCWAFNGCLCSIELVRRKGILELY
jgi:hypothetical protein